VGLLSDFLVADAQDIPAILQSVNPSAKWESAQFKGLTPVNLCQLWAILKHAPYQDSDVEKFKDFSSNDQGPWALVVPAQLTSSIAALGEADVPRVGKLWSQTEELTADHWQPADVTALLEAIRKLSTSAVHRKKSLILWVSL
jgi:hypothetical protein